MFVADKQLNKTFDEISTEYTADIDTAVMIWVAAGFLKWVDIV